MKRVVQFPDGHVEIVTLFGADLEEAWQAHLALNPQHVDLPYVDVNEAALPDRNSRIAWRLVNGQVVVDAAADAASDAPGIEQQAATSDLEAQYVAAIARLDQIIGAASPTNAQVIAAVRDMATYERKILRFLHAEYTDGD